MIQARTHHVYRAYDESGLLLYVGCSGNIVARIASHRHGPSIWYPYHDRIDFAGPWSKDDALDIEANAIADELPYFNAQRDHTRGVQANRNEARRLLALEGIPRDAYYDESAPAAEMDAAANEYQARLWEVRHEIRDTFPFVDDHVRRAWYLAAPPEDGRLMYPLTILQWWHEAEWHEIGWRAYDPQSAADLRVHGERLANVGGSYRLVQPSHIADAPPVVVHAYDTA